jgi:hypothetical protein
MRVAATLAAAAALGATPLAGPSRPDSKVARNVLEGKAEGYCSVSGTRIRRSPALTLA